MLFAILWNVGVFALGLVAGLGLLAVAIIRTPYGPWR